MFWAENRHRCLCNYALVSVSFWKASLYAVDASEKFATGCQGSVVVTRFLKNLVALPLLLIPCSGSELLQNMGPEVVDFFALEED